MIGSLKVEIDPTIQATVTATAASLQRAGLFESLDEITQRVIDTARLTEVRHGASRLACAVVLAPYAELVLREATAIGNDARLDDATKAARISQALNIAGF